MFKRPTLTVFLFLGLAHSGYSANQLVFHPIPLSPELEIVNPLRGLYTWLGYDVAPQPEAPFDRYTRIPWAALEPQQSRYDWSLIENEIAKVRKGGSFSFRITALNPSWNWKDGSNVPEYLMAELPKGFFVPVAKRNRSSPSHLYIPDWNSPIFLDRLDKLLSALGQKYDGDPRIGFIDIGVYGMWGEWHVFGLSDYPHGVIPYDDAQLNSKGAALATLGSRKRIVDEHVNAFKKTRLVMMTDDKEALLYALGLSTPVPIGMRRDSFGSDHFSEQLFDEKMTQADKDKVLNRWRTAPFIVESFGPPHAFQVGADRLAQQVERFHLAAIGNAGFAPGWNQMSAEEQQGILAAGRRTGYRFSVTAATLSPASDGGPELLLSSQWVNQGVTPAYEPWKVEFSLWKLDTKKPAVTVVSTLNLESFLPAGSPIDVKDLLPMPGKFTRGSYELRVKVSDPRYYRTPLRLAIEGAMADGGYSLGSVVIN